jgi:hypothetical protein
MTYGQAARNWSKNAKGGRSMSVRVGGAEMRRSRSNTWSMSVGERARMEPCVCGIRGTCKKSGAL